MSENTENTEVTPVTRESLDDLGQMMLSRVDGWATEATNASAIIAAANSDDAKAMVVTLRDSHPEYPAYLALIEEAETILARIDAENEPNVEKPSEADVTAATETLSSLREQAKAAITFLVGAYGEGARDLMPSVLKGKRGGGAKGSSGIKRPRMQAILVQDSQGETVLHLMAGADKPEDKPTFSALAKWLSDKTGETVETSTLQNLAFEAAGTKDLSTVAKTEFAVAGPYFVTATSKVTDN